MGVEVDLMTTMRRTVTIACFFLLIAASAAAAATDPEREAREIEDLLIAPCCFSQQVSVHLSPTATAVKRDIRTRLARGESRQVILDAYVAEHGVAVLAVPPARGSNLVLYVLPPLALAGSVLLVVGIVRRFTSAEDAPPPPAALATEGSDTRIEQLEDELRDLD